MLVVVVGEVGSRQLKSQRSQRSTLVVQLNQSYSLKLYSSGTLHMLHRVRQSIPVGRAIAFPQADTIQRGVLYLRKMASTIWGMTQHRYPRSYFLRFSPQSHQPQTFLTYP